MPSEYAQRHVRAAFTGSIILRLRQCCAGPACRLRQLRHVLGRLHCLLTLGVPVLQYHNIFALVRELGIQNPFTDWTTSGFWSPQGLTTEAPVFSRRPQLPTMLGQFVHTLPLFRRAPLLIS